jgi:hypothetical protein
MAASKYAEIGETEVLECGLIWPRGTLERGIIKSLAFGGVYAAGWRNTGPFKIGWTMKPQERFVRLQNDSPYNMRLYEFVWTLDSSFAIRLHTEIERLLHAGGRHLRGDWFDLPSDFLPGVFQVATDNLKIKTFTHQAFLEEVASIRERALKRTERLDKNPPSVVGAQSYSPIPSVS